MEDGLRTDLTPGSTNQNQKSGFINNYNSNYQDAIVWDAIKVADPYTPPANSHTQSFTLSSQMVVTKTPFVSTYGIQTKINSTIVVNNIGNTAGNMSFRVLETLHSDDVLEYTIYETVKEEQQSLSKALRPTADN